MPELFNFYDAPVLLETGDLAGFLIGDISAAAISPDTPKLLFSRKEAAYSLPGVTGSVFALDRYLPTASGYPRRQPSASPRALVRQRLHVLAKRSIRIFLLLLIQCCTNAAQIQLSMSSPVLVTGQPVLKAPLVQREPLGQKVRLD
jgi:hypothetical protein